MSDKFHVNPETGRTGICRATTHGCRFDLSNSEHYNSREEAAQGYENKMEAASMNVRRNMEILEKELVNPEVASRSSFDLMSFYFKNIKNNEDEKLSQEQRENFYTAVRIQKLMNGKLTDENKAKIEDALSRLHKPHASARFDSMSQISYKLPYSMYIKKIAEELPVRKAPEREKSEIIGLNDAQKEIVKMANGEYFDYGEEYICIYNDVSKDTDNTINRIIAGEKYPALSEYEENSLIPERDRLIRILSNPDNPDYNNQLYMGTVFPDKELKESFKKHNVTGVSVSPFYNSREYGLAYTVMEPNGNTRTFSVYEHRNTDSIIINGRTNWDPSSELPYAADSKNEFFAEFAYDDREQVADALAFYAKSAQNGDLPDDETLVRSASKRDWRAILSEKIPGFKTWADETYGTDEDDAFERLRKGL